MDALRDALGEPDDGGPEGPFGFLFEPKRAVPSGPAGAPGLASFDPDHPGDGDLPDDAPPPATTTVDDGWLDEGTHAWTNEDGTLAEGGHTHEAFEPEDEWITGWYAPDPKPEPPDETPPDGPGPMDEDGGDPKAPDDDDPPWGPDDDDFGAPPGELPADFDFELPDLGEGDFEDSLVAGFGPEPAEFEPPPFRPPEPETGDDTPPPYVRPLTSTSFQHWPALIPVPTNLVAMLAKLNEAAAGPSRLEDAFGLFWDAHGDLQVGVFAGDLHSGATIEGPGAAGSAHTHGGQIQVVSGLEPLFHHYDVGPIGRNTPPLEQGQSNDVREMVALAIRSDKPAVAIVATREGGIGLFVAWQTELDPTQAWWAYYKLEGDVFVLDRKPRARPGTPQPSPPYRFPPPTGPRPP